MPSVAARRFRFRKVEILKEMRTVAGCEHRAQMCEYGELWMDFCQ